MRPEVDGHPGAVRCPSRTWDLPLTVGRIFGDENYFLMRSQEDERGLAHVPPWHDTYTQFRVSAAALRLGLVSGYRTRHGDKSEAFSFFVACFNTQRIPN